MDRRRVGLLGERMAEALVVRHGGRVVGRNLRAGRDELDLVAAFGDRMIVFEVKTRVAGPFSPDLNFDDRKATALRRGARALGIVVSRIDLITVELDKAGAALRWIAAVDCASS